MSIRSALIAALAGAVLLSAALLGLRMYGSAERRAGREECQQAQAMAELKVFRTESERLAGLSIDLQQRITDLQAATPTIIERYTRVEIEKPLPAGCVLDAGRLQRINDAIAAANAARQSGSAVRTGTVPAD